MHCVVGLTFVTCSDAIPSARLCAQISSTKGLLIVCMMPAAIVAVERCFRIRKPSRYELEALNLFRGAVQLLEIRPVESVFLLGGH